MENNRSLTSKVIIVTPNQNKLNAIPTVAASNDIEIALKNDNKICLHAEAEESSSSKRLRIDVEEIPKLESLRDQDPSVKRKRKILNIQKNHRLLQKRIRCLNDLFEYLIEKQLISLESVEKIMVNPNLQ